MDGWYIYLKSSGKNNDPLGVFSVKMVSFIFLEKTLVLSLLRKNIATTTLLLSTNGVKKPLIPERIMRVMDGFYCIPQAKMVHFGKVGCIV